jgi:hypothetical protein
MVIRQRPHGTRGQERAAVYFAQPRPREIPSHTDLSACSLDIRFRSCSFAPRPTRHPQSVLFSLPHETSSRLDPGRAQVEEPVYVASAPSRLWSYLQLRLAATQRPDLVGFEFRSLFPGADKLFQTCAGLSCFNQEAAASPDKTKNRSRNGPWDPLERIPPHHRSSWGPKI